MPNTRNAPLADLATAEKALNDALATYNAARMRAGMTGVGNVMARDEKVILRFNAGGHTPPAEGATVLTDC